MRRGLTTSLDESTSMAGVSDCLENFRNGAN
jgi:hypothetical protein